MAPTAYVCNRHAYREHYGHGLKTFVGEVPQNGHGLGNFLSGIFRKAVPLLTKHVVPILKSTASKAGKTLLRSGANVAHDVIVDRKNLKDSLKRHAKTGLHDLIDDITSEQKGQGRIRKPARKKSCAKRRRANTDIFD